MSGRQGLELLFPLRYRDATPRPVPWPQPVLRLDDWSRSLYAGFDRVASQMPCPHAVHTGVPVSVEPALPLDAAPFGHGTLALFVTPQGDAVICLSVAVDGGLDPFMRTLRAVRDHDAGHHVCVDGVLPIQALAARSSGAMQNRVAACEQVGPVSSQHVCLIDTDQIPLLRTAPGGVVERDVAKAVDLEVIGRLVYYDAYANTPLRSAQSGVRFPPLANRYDGTVAAVSPNGSVIAGHADGLTAGMVLAHVIVLGAMQRARAVRAAAYADLAALTAIETDVAARPVGGVAGGQVDLGSRVADLAERTGRHRVALAFGAEAYLDIEPIVPSSVIGSYHRALIAVTRTGEAIGTANLLVDRLSEALGALRAVVVAAERRHDEARNTHLTRVGGLLAAIALVLTFVFGVYGSNAGPVGKQPLVDFRPGYLVFFLAILALVYIIGSIYRGNWSWWRRGLVDARARGTPSSAETTAAVPTARRVPVGNIAGVPEAQADPVAEAVRDGAA
jgi:hypothetical protein